MNLANANKNLTDAVARIPGKFAGTADEPVHDAALLEKKAEDWLRTLSDALVKADGRLATVKIDDPTLHKNDAGVKVIEVRPTVEGGLTGKAVIGAFKPIPPGPTRESIDPEDKLNDLAAAHAIEGAARDRAVFGASEAVQQLAEDFGTQWDGGTLNTKVRRETTGGTRPGVKASHESEVPDVHGFVLNAAGERAGTIRKITGFDAQGEELFSVENPAWIIAKYL